MEIKGTVQDCYDGLQSCCDRKSVTICFNLCQDLNYKIQLKSGHDLLEGWQNMRAFVSMVINIISYRYVKLYSTYYKYHYTSILN